MEEIGNLFLLTRQAAGISIKEVSEDLGIEQVILENIEDGKSGAFSDIFLLKEYVAGYAKYLGLDYERIIDEFNEYVFESTSKIPTKDIEKQIIENKKNEGQTRVVSPYTRKEKTIKGGLYLTVYIVIVLLAILAVFWSVKQITINNQNASMISYRK